MRRAGHVVLRVTDVQRMKSFLEKVAGFQTSGSVDAFFFMSANPVANHHMIAIRPDSGKGGALRMPDARQIGMVSAAYEVASFDDLRTLFGRIARDGAAYGARIVDVRRRGAIEHVRLRRR